MRNSFALIRFSTLNIGWKKLPELTKCPDFRNGWTGGLVSLTGADFLLSSFFFLPSIHSTAGV